VGLFRRRNETLNERLLREAGLDPAEALGDPQPTPTPQPEVQAPAFGKVALPDGSQVDPKEWDAAVTVRVADLHGERIEFTTVPNGDVIVGEEAGDADLSPLADAVERHVDPPYRAVAQRQDRDMWAVAAKRIEVAKIPLADGEKLALSRHGRDSEFRVDDEPHEGVVPLQLAALGEAAGDDFYVEAERIDGDLWEVRATAL
jgi:hypothetical protein